MGLSLDKSNIPAGGARWAKCPIDGKGFLFFLSSSLIPLATLKIKTLFGTMSASNVYMRRSVLKLSLTSLLKALKKEGEIL